jgi:hypothetical protein
MLAINSQLLATPSITPRPPRLFAAACNGSAIASTKGRKKQRKMIDEKTMSHLFQTPAAKTMILFGCERAVREPLQRHGRTPVFLRLSLRGAVDYFFKTQPTLVAASI